MIQQTLNSKLESLNSTEPGRATERPDAIYRRSVRAARRARPVMSQTLDFKLQTLNSPAAREARVAVSSAFKRFLAAKKIIFGSVFDSRPLQISSLSLYISAHPCRCDKFQFPFLPPKPVCPLNPLSLHGFGSFALSQPRKKAENRHVNGWFWGVFGATLIPFLAHDRALALSEARIPHLPFLSSSCARSPSDESQEFLIGLYVFPFRVGWMVTMKICCTIRLKVPLLFLTCSLLGSARVLSQDSFTRITSGPIVSGVNSTVLAWGDFNNDGFQDLYVSTRTGNSLLYSNNGNGTFSQIIAAPVGTDAGNCFGATWADYDNDGFLDLFVGVNNFGNDWLYHNNGLGGFTKVTAGAIVSSAGNANNCGWADYDNDGFIDLFVANSDQNDFLYHNNRDGTFTRTTNNPIVPSRLLW